MSKSPVSRTIFTFDRRAEDRCPPPFTHQLDVPEAAVVPCDVEAPPPESVLYGEVYADREYLRQDFIR